MRGVFVVGLSGLPWCLVVRVGTSRCCRPLPIYCSSFSFMSFLQYLVKRMNTPLELSTLLFLSSVNPYIFPLYYDAQARWWYFHVKFLLLCVVRCPCIFVVSAQDFRLLIMAVFYGLFSGRGHLFWRPLLDLPDPKRTSACVNTSTIQYCCVLHCTRRNVLIVTLPAVGRI